MMEATQRIGLYPQSWNDCRPAEAMLILTPIGHRNLRFEFYAANSRHHLSLAPSSKKKSCANA